MKTVRNLLTTIVFAAALTLLAGFVSIKAEAKVTDGAIPYTGDEVNSIKADGNNFGMFSPQPGTRIGLAGDSVIIHYVPKNATIYGWIHWGAINDAELTKDVAFTKEGTSGYYDIVLPKSACGKAVMIAPIKNDGTGTTTTQYYLAVPSADNISNWESLTVTNKLNMFKIIDAHYSTADSAIFIVLSGSGYHDLIPATYDEAVALGDNRDSWIKGSLDDNDKWGFLIPVDTSKPYMPLVAVSNSYLTKYEAGQNPLERAFYPRQISLDFANKSLVSDDYHETIDLVLTNNVKMFKPSSATMTTSGGPNSNGYTVTVDLTMENTSFSKVYFGEKEEAETAGDKVIDLSAGNIFKGITVEEITKPGDTSSIVSSLDQKKIISFYSTSKQIWYERFVTISKKNKTIVFDSSDANYSKVNDAIAAIPADLSIYTDETAKAVNDAKDAVVTGLNVNHQDEVDAMAQAINDAVGKLYTKAQANQDAADNVQALIDKAKESYSTAAQKQAAIDAAKAAFDKLTDEQKALLTSDAQKDLNDAQTAANTQKSKEQAAELKKMVGTTAKIGALIYKVTSTTTAAVVKPVKNTNTSVNIPGSVKIKGKTFKVTAINANAFKSNKKLKSLTIGPNVKTIGASAFQDCVKLKTITIPASVTNIGAKAFAKCKKAKKLIIKGTAIKSFGKKAFAKTGIKKFSAPAKVRKSYRKKLIKAGMKKSVK